MVGAKKSQIHRFHSMVGIVALEDLSRMFLWFMMVDKPNGLLAQMEATAPNLMSLLALPLCISVMIWLSF